MESEPGAPPAWQFLLQPDCVTSFEAFRERCEAPDVDGGRWAVAAGAADAYTLIMQELAEAFAGQSRKVAAYAQKLQDFTEISVCVVCPSCRLPLV